MKKLFVLYIVCTALVFTSCEDWLDMPSETKFDSSTIFESISKAEMAVLGCYASTFNREFYYQLGMGTDEVISTEGDTNSKNQIANYIYTTSNAPSSLYNAMYAGIEYANVCISSLQQMSASSEQEQQKIDMLLGESLAIRAMNYLNLVRFFGDVPYPTIPVVEMDDFSSSRVSRDIVLDGCVEDLERAVALLPWQSEGRVATVERFTKNSAYGLLARVALYGAGYSLRWDLETFAPASVKLAKREDESRIRELYKIAVDACEAVITRGENQLLDNYEMVFRDLVNGRYNTESMLEIGQFGPNVNGHVTGYTNGMYIHTSALFGKSQPAMHAIATYWFDFEEGDSRRDVSITNFGVNADNERIMNTYASNTIGKFRATWKEEKGTAINKRDINWPMLRYSDVLLMYAEALNEFNNGPTSAAVNALEEVRARAYGDASLVGEIPADYEAFREAIIHERKLELGFEAWRRTDLIRWGVHFEKLTETKQRLIDLANREGDYAHVDLYRAYKVEKVSSFADPVAAVSFIGLKEEPDVQQMTALESDGYVLLEMHGSQALSFSNRLGENEVWVQSLFRGLEKNKVELLPLHTSNILEVNPGLQGQQHPLY